VPDRPQLDLANFLPYLINRVGVAMVASFTENALVAHDLSIDMWRVLAALAQGGEQRQVDLCAKTSIDASTMSRLVTRLVRMGLVARARSKTSSREVVVGLAPKGSALVQRIIPVAHQLEATAIAGLPTKDLAAVKRALRLFYDNLAKARAAR
jgi:MarR family transcriptional regulator, organic hydroperoxide resistance regulator